MKSILALLFSLTVLTALVSCESDDPARPPLIRPLRMEMDDYQRELIFDQKDRLAGIRMISFYPNDVTLETTLNFFYSATGRIDSSATTEGHKFKYTYENGLLTRSDEYIGEVSSQHYTFSYDSRKRLIETLTWQYIPEEGGWIAHQKSTYTYNEDDNLTESVLYYYNTGTDQHELLTRFTYSDYDDKKSADQFFDVASFNPTIRFRQNNPGKMVVQNMHGNTTSIDIYSHQYHASGYPEKRITTVTFPHNGQTGSYETKFLYETK